MIIIGLDLIFKLDSYILRLANSVLKWSDNLLIYWSQMSLGWVYDDPGQAPYLRCS